MGDRGPARTKRVLDAVQGRISEQGDMPIRISIHTMETLLRAVGLGMWDAGQDTFREVDALALDALRFLAKRENDHALDMARARQAALANKDPSR